VELDGRGQYIKPNGSEGRLAQVKVFPECPEENWVADVRVVSALLDEMFPTDVNASSAANERLQQWVRELVGGQLFGYLSGDDQRINEITDESRKMICAGVHAQRDTSQFLLVKHQ
jgi:hypothetical protein